MTTSTPSPAKLGRFTVARGRQGARPPRDLVYGGPVGKSTFAADYPSPIFLAEDGAVGASGGLDAARVEPAPETWGEAIEVLEALRIERHDLKTLVIDPIERIELLIHRDVTRAHDAFSIEDVGPYKRGLTEALAYWHDLARRLERLARERGMGVVLISRAIPKTVRPRGAEPYDGVVLGIEERAATFLRGWAHAVLFAEQDEAGARWLYTTARPGAEARSRDALPRRLELSYSELDRLRRRSRAELATELRAEGERLAEQLRSSERREGLRDAGGRRRVARPGRGAPRCL